LGDQRSSSFTFASALRKSSSAYSGSSPSFSFASLTLTVTAAGDANSRSTFAIALSAGESLCGLGFVACEELLSRGVDALGEGGVASFSFGVWLGFDVGRLRGAAAGSGLRGRGLGSGLLCAGNREIALSAGRTLVLSRGVGME
jgi:hypothetical protein